MQGNRSAFTPPCDFLLHEETLLHMYSMNQAPCCHLGKKIKRDWVLRRAGAAEQRLGNYERGEWREGLIRVSAFMQVVSTTTTKIKQRSRTSAFSYLVRPHHSKASEAKNSVHTFPRKPAHSVFQQLTPLPHKAGTMGTIPSPPGKNTSGKFSLIKYLCLLNTHLLTQQCKLGGLHDQLCGKIQLAPPGFPSGLYKSSLGLDRSMGKTEGMMFLGNWGSGKVIMCFPKLFILFFSKLSV